VARARIKYSKFVQIAMAPLLTAANIAEGNTTDVVVLFALDAAGDVWALRRYGVWEETDKPGETRGSSREHWVRVSSERMRCTE
jgi:hypothetical protein